MDSDLNFSSHTQTITDSACYHLKNILRIKGVMSLQDLETLVSAFIFSRLYKALNDLGPKYISDLLRHQEPSRPLRSSGTGPLWVPRVKTNNGGAVLSYYAPQIWNKLQANAGLLQLTSFTSRLRTFLFTAAFHWSDFHNIFSYFLFFFQLVLMFCSLMSSYLFWMYFKCNF